MRWRGLNAIGAVWLAVATVTGQSPSTPMTRSAASDQREPGTLASQIPARRHFDHAAEIVSDYRPSADETRVWIRGGEDDLRLWSPRGQQMEMDFHAWYTFKGQRLSELPALVQFSFETHGETRPGALPLALTLVADGRAVPLRETIEPLAKSGALVFYTTHATLTLADFLTLVRASRVEGRCWGHPFVLLPSQLEILRDLASRLSSPSGP